MPGAGIIVHQKNMQALRALVTVECTIIPLVGWMAGIYLVYLYIFDRKRYNKTVRRLAVILYVVALLIVCCGSYLVYENWPLFTYK